MRKLEDLDQFDRKILSVLQAEGRLAVVDLSEQIGLSKSPCLKRLRKLEKEGFITGYRAVIDPVKVRQSHLAYVQITLSSTKLNKLEAFNRAVQDIPEIMSCHMMAGGYDYLLKVRTRNMQEYRIFLGEVVANLPGVYQTSTFPVMEEVKDTQALTIEPSRD